MRLLDALENGYTGSFKRVELVLGPNVDSPDVRRPLVGGRRAAQERRRLEGECPTDGPEWVFSTSWKLRVELTDLFEWRFGEELLPAQDPFESCPAVRIGLVSERGFDVSKKIFGILPQAPFVSSVGKEGLRPGELGGEVWRDDLRSVLEILLPDLG